MLEEGLSTGGKIIGAFLETLPGQPAKRSQRIIARKNDATNIFHTHRIDHQTILDLIPHDASVVDLGCGHGDLLSILRERGCQRLLGIERDQEAVADGIARGHDIIHADIEAGLHAIADKSYDVALLSQTLQSIVDVEGVLEELLRVGRRGIVSFPNFAHRPMREMFLHEGRVPKEEGFYAYDWHNTPNRRFPSILDFQELCEAMGICIVDAAYLDSRKGCQVVDDPNMNADVAVVSLAHHPIDPTVG